jgi:hypothetical protein
MTQGKEWNQQEVIEILKPLFQLGYSVTKACNIAGIPQSTVATWISADEELRLQITTWQNEINVIARKQWKSAIIEGKPTKFGPDMYTPSKEWLERIERDDFAIRTQSQTDNTNTNLNTEIKDDDDKPAEQKLQEVLERIKELQEE